MLNEVAQKEMATATAATSVIKSETIHTSDGPVQCITPILIKEEPSEIHVTKIVYAYKDELPAVPDHMFHQTKWEPDDPAESYSEYETVRSDYLSDDVDIPPEADSDEAAEFVDETLAVHSLENINTGLAKIQDGFLMAANGYENIRWELPNLDPMEIPKIIGTSSYASNEWTFKTSTVTTYQDNWKYHLNQYPSSNYWIKDKVSIT